MRSMHTRKSTSLIKIFSFIRYNDFKTWMNSSYNKAFSDITNQIDVTSVEVSHGWIDLGIKKPRFSEINLNKKFLTNVYYV